MVQSGFVVSVESADRETFRDRKIGSVTYWPSWQEECASIDYMHAEQGVDVLQRPTRVI